MGLITLSLKLAFREPGCPVCRLRQESTDRYLFGLLYEYVNDGSTRFHFVRGIGFCHQHAWALQAMERRHWQKGMKEGILYEDLAARVLDSLSQYLARNPASTKREERRLCQWLKRLGSLGRWLAHRRGCVEPAESLLERISPAAGCRVCAIADRSEAIHLQWLMRHMLDPEFRSWYAASDGLCLPHFRRALAHAEDEESARYLAEFTAVKLGLLWTNLQEHVRKGAWHNRHEPKLPQEEMSWVRAVAFFAGEAREESEEDDRLRRKALHDYRMLRDIPSGAR